MNFTRKDVLAAAPAFPAMAAPAQPLPWIQTEENPLRSIFAETFAVSAATTIFQLTNKVQGKAMVIAAFVKEKACS